MAAAAVTASPYLAALRAAAAIPAKSSVHQIESSEGGDDSCFVCGSIAPAGQAYCSDSCRAQDEAPSPPAPTALPALVSSRRGLRSDGSASSPPSSSSGHLESEEDDIERFSLGPSLHSYAQAPTAAAKKAAYVSPYSYNLTNSPATLARSPTKSPVVRPVTSALGSRGTPTKTFNGLLSPQYGPVTSRRPSTAPMAIAASSSAPAPPVEELTFRRRFNPEQQGSNASPALLASRRRSSNLPSPLFLAKNPSAPPMTHRSVSSTSSSSSSSSRVSETSSSKYPQSAAQASLSRLLDGSKPVKGGLVTSPFFGSTKSPSSATLKASSSAPRKSLPLNRPHMISAPSSIHGYHPASRRVSEPLSPYYSPGLTSPNPSDPFSSAFGDRAASFSSSRPSMSTSWSAPLVPGSASPLASSAATTRPQDYSGFAGFLHNRHTKSSPVVSPTSAPSPGKHRGSHGTESGYDAQDEELQQEKRSSSVQNGSTKKTTSPVVTRRSLAHVSNGLRDARSAQATVTRDRLAALSHGTADSSASSSSDGSQVLARGRGHQFARGGAFRGLLHENEQNEEQDDGERRGRRSRQSTVKASEQRGATVTQPADYRVNAVPMHKQHQTAAAVDSAIITSSSASSSEEEENARGRGRASRTTSSTGPERRLLVSPFTALERAAAGLPHQNAPPFRKASRDAAVEAQQERGRMTKRNSSSEGQRNGSQTRSRSRTEARTSRRA